MEFSIGLVMLVFGFLVVSCAILGLITWALVAILPPLREEHPELFSGLGRLSGQWLGLGVLSFALGILAGPGLP